MGTVIYLRRMLSWESQWLDVIAEICSITETTIILEGASLFSLNYILSALQKRGTIARTFAVDGGYRVTWDTQVDVISYGEVAAIIEKADKVLSF
jgi:hypothetical protein